MIDYLYLEDRKNYGSIAISNKVIVQLVNQVLLDEGVTLYGNKTSKSLKVSYKEGTAFIKIKISLEKNKNEEEVITSLKEKIATSLLLSVGHIPLNIEIRVED